MTSYDYDTGAPQETQDRELQLGAVLEYLKEKKEVLAKAYFGAKEIISVDDGMSLRNRRM